MSIENKKLATIFCPSKSYPPFLICDEIYIRDEKTISGPSEICPPFYICDEMKKLREWLDKKGIEWEDETEKNYCFGWMARTHFTYKDNFVSVINGYRSYGGFSRFKPNNEGLLEMMIGENEPIGWLTSDQVITYLEKQCIDFLGNL